MSIVIKGYKHKTISVKDLKDGQIALVSRESEETFHEYVGMVMQRCYDSLFQVGGCFSWSGLYEDGVSKNRLSGMRVYVLENGTMLEIQGNENEL